MGAAHTSVPRWPTSDPGVDQTGRAYALIGFGARAAPAVARWATRIAALGRPLRVLRLPEFDAEPLNDLLADAVVGWRLMLAGPEVDVLRAHAVAREHGAVGAELRILVTDDRRRRVRCAHCTATTAADVRPDERLPCSGCGRELVVHAHVSRVHAAYLGSLP